MPIRNKWPMRLAIIAVTIALGAVLVRWIDLHELATFLAPEHLPGLAVAGIFFVAVNVIRGIRIAKLTTKYLGLSVDIVSGIGLATVTNLANHVLPLRLGDVVYVTLSRSVFRVPIVQGAGVLLTMRIYDLIGLTLLALAGLAGAPQIAAHVSWWVLALAAAALLAVAVRLDLVFAIAAKVIPKLKDAIPFTKEPAFVASSLVYSVSIWTAQAVGFAIMLRVFGIDVGIAPMVVATSIANLAATLPLSALGTFGALEAGWAAGFIAMGVDAKAATTSGLAAHIVMVAVNVVLALCFVRAFSKSARQ
jgi:uncharacterized membrane protein YbhN (UPF0104 family)